eukprot:5117606-Amphidinium_carterae.1
MNCVRWPPGLVSAKQLEETAGIPEAGSNSAPPFGIDLPRFSMLGSCKVGRFTDRTPALSFTRNPTTVELDPSPSQDPLCASGARPGNRSSSLSWLQPELTRAYHA